MWVTMIFGNQNYLAPEFLHILWKAEDRKRDTKQWIDFARRVAEKTPIPEH